MKITIKELRSMIKSVVLLEKGSDVRKSDVFSDIQFNPDGHDVVSSFLDRWGHTLPTRPESLSVASVRNWLEAYNVNSVSVRNKKMSPNSFLKFIGFMGKNPGNIPLVKGTKGDEGSTKTGEIPVVKGTPVKKQRRQYTDEPPNEFFRAWPV